MAERGYAILELPTGLGLVVKRYPRVRGTNPARACA